VVDDVEAGGDKLFAGPGAGLGVLAGVEGAAVADVAGEDADIALKLGGEGAVGLIERDGGADVGAAGHVDAAKPEEAAGDEGDEKQDPKADCRAAGDEGKGPMKETWGEHVCIY
jgi:hypothetical protein